MLKRAAGLVCLLLVLSINAFSIETTSKDVDVNRIKNKMKRANYLDKELRKDRLMYIKGDNEPFTGTLFLMLGDYLEYTEVYENGVLQGDKTWYDPNGNIMMIESYTDGRIHGEQVTYYPNTVIRSVITYYKGRITKVEWNNDKGRSIFKEIYENGSGRWRHYYDNGTLHEEGEYLNGLKHGVWRKYNEKGELERKTVYNMGSIIGKTWY
ncbi:MAG: toxin-antitoxin system YwqK family antitoxin [Fusobacteriaceae bacterium]|nr:toxin-antitoxin system YwqK family antitoxin [Fusobacteriaceae bacterium]MBP9509857.1 toxin-antitoxin system YwqK family antitoxin [Fusobacteriaceae bacterium]